MFPEPSAGECGGHRDTHRRWAPPRGTSSSRWAGALSQALGQQEQALWGRAEREGWAAPQGPLQQGLFTREGFLGWRVRSQALDGSAAWVLGTPGGL